MAEFIDARNWPTEVDKDRLVCALNIQLEPVAKGRPRFGQGRVFTPSKTVAYEAAIKNELRKAINFSLPDATSCFGFRAIFYRANRQRIDCDNLLKAIQDAATGVIWRDDSQVREIFGRLSTGSPFAPHVSFVFYTVMDDAPKSLCPQCGGEYVRYKSTRKKYCSLKCRRLASYRGVVCAYCSQEFFVPKSTIRAGPMACSRDCAKKYVSTMKTKAAGGHKWKCKSCGGGVSRKEYLQCRKCFTLDRLSAGEPKGNYWEVRYRANATSIAPRFKQRKLTSRFDLDRILAEHANGKTNLEIATLIGARHTTISRLVRQAKRLGLIGNEAPVPAASA